MTKLSAEDVLKLSPVMPVVVIDDADLAEPLARVLLAAGVKTIEVTLRTPAA
ncbi:MAG: keto-deoxy-phosphogluconate aldolase, partial [Hyphomonadaceae bacterium]|nr:keto-deoxy-phosphogluconate aldolase [Hyphomonadaceae bacterium]